MKNILRYIIISSLAFFSFGIKINAVSNIIVDKESLVPYFSKSTHRYNLFVSEDTEYINISFTKESTDDYVSGGGKVNLKKGENVLNIVVNKLDGAKEEYTLIVYRGYKNVKDYSSATLSDLKIEDYKINFDANIYDYVIDIDKNVTELDITYEATSEYAKVILEGNSNLNESENKIIITVKSHDEKITNIYTITARKTITTFNEEDGEKEVTRSFTREEKILTAIAVCAGAISLIYFSYKIIFRKKKKKNNPR